MTEAETAASIADLVKRLRVRSDQKTDEYLQELAGQAADTIKAQAARIAELEERVTLLVASIADLVKRLLA